MSSVNGSLMTVVFDDTRDTPMLGRTSADCFREAEWWRHRAALYLDAAVGVGVGTMALLLLLVLFPFVSAAAALVVGVVAVLVGGLLARWLVGNYRDAMDFAVWSLEGACVGGDRG